MKTIRNHGCSRYGLLVLAGISSVAVGSTAVATASETGSARDGLDLARAAALTWAEDARLIYIENDDPLDVHGAAPRWGYLFWSAALDKHRIYSIERGEIRVASDLGFAFDAPPLPTGWIDSNEAFAAARSEVDGEFAAGSGEAAKTMLLVRGILSDDRPDAATWAVVYSAPGVPSLFVVVDAEDGKVIKKWRG